MDQPRGARQRRLYAGANVTIVAVAADRGVPTGVTIEQGCKTTFTSIVPPAPPVVPAAQAPPSPPAK